MMLKLQILFVIIYVVYSVNSQQLINKDVTEKPVQSVNTFNRMTLKRSDKQISNLEEFVDQSGGGNGNGRSVWSWLTNLFKGKEEDSSDDPNDILPFGLGNKLLNSVNSILGRVNTLITVSNVELKPRKRAIDQNAIVTVMDIPE